MVIFYIIKKKKGKTNIYFGHQYFVLTRCQKYINMILYALRIFGVIYFIKNQEKLGKIENPSAQSNVKLILQKTVI